MKINNFNDLLGAKLPAEVIRDIEKRITDWLASGGKEEDPYIEQQYRYAENFLKITRPANNSQVKY